MDTTIKIGDKVRSFDFDSRELVGPLACYVEGTVTAIEYYHGCDHYRIIVDKTVFAGDRLDIAEVREVLAPLNGTASWLGGKTNGVEKLDESIFGMSDLDKYLMLAAIENDERNGYGY